VARVLVGGQWKDSNTFHQEAIPGAGSLLEISKTFTFWQGPVTVRGLKTDKGYTTSDIAIQRGVSRARKDDVKQNAKVLEPHNEVDHERFLCNKHFGTVVRGLFGPHGAIHRTDKVNGCSKDSNSHPRN